MDDDDDLVARMNTQDDDKNLIFVPIMIPIGYGPKTATNQMQTTSNDYKLTPRNHEGQMMTNSVISSLNIPKYEDASTPKYKGEPEKVPGTTNIGLSAKHGEEELTMPVTDTTIENRYTDLKVTTTIVSNVQPAPSNIKI